MFPLTACASEILASAQFFWEFAEIFVFQPIFVSEIK